MTSLIQCDICSEVVESDSTYKLRIHRVSPSLFLIPKTVSKSSDIDVCHSCYTQKFMPIINMQKLTWKRWDSETKTFTVNEKVI